MNSRHGYKLIAPIVITVLLVLLSIGWFLCYLAMDMAVTTLVGALFCGGCAGVSCYVLYERIKEIRSGEEDDLSKY